MSTPSPIRLALIEDSRVFVGELCELLKLEQDIQCVAVCPSATAAREKLPALALDVVLVDMGLPDGSGAELIGVLAPQIPKTDFVVLTVCDDREIIEAALRNGAKGYLLKSSSGAQIVQAVRQVREGGFPLDFQATRHLLDLFREQPLRDGLLPELTAQENRLLSELSQGASVKEAGTAIGVTYASARTYARRIYAKLGVRSRMEAIRRYLNPAHPASGAGRVGSGQKR